MVDIRNIHVGDKVRIVDKWCMGCRQNGGGLMDKWLGGVLTVRSVCGDYIKLEEDADDFYGNTTPGWDWFPEAIAEVLSPDYEEAEDDFTVDDQEFCSLIMG